MGDCLECAFPEQITASDSSPSHGRWLTAGLSQHPPSLPRGTLPLGPTRRLIQFGNFQFLGQIPRRWVFIKDLERADPIPRQG